jgi:hypothetical protein
MQLKSCCYCIGGDLAVVIVVDAIIGGQGVEAKGIERSGRGQNKRKWNAATCSASESWEYGTTYTPHMLSAQ